MLRKPRVDRRVTFEHRDGQAVLDIPPAWAFTLQCPIHGRYRFSFSVLQSHGRKRLAGQVRDCIWALRHELALNTLYSTYSSLTQYFWPFLDDLSRSGQDISELRDVDESVIRAYLAWLSVRIVLKGPGNGSTMSVGGQRKQYGVFKRILVACQRLQPRAVSPALRFPKNPFPLSNFKAVHRTPYSDQELSRLIDTINADLKAIDEGGSQALTPLQFVVVHILALALATGRNRQSLLELRRDCLRPHPLEDREILTTEKRRGGNSHATAYLIRRPASRDASSTSTIPTSVGDHVRAVKEYSEHLVSEACDADKGFLFLYPRTYSGKGKPLRLSSTGLAQGLCDFSRRHALVDDSGRPMVASIARCRPTFATRLYARTRDIRKVQQALNHASPETTRRYYVSLPNDAERNHAFVGRALVGWATSQDDARARRLAADGEIPLEEARDLLSGGYNTLIARCKNPYRENDGICGKYLACFRCPQMVVFEDDLYRLYSFYFKLLSEQVTINARDWMKTYGPIIQIIDLEIASQFPQAVVAAAKQRAIESPHPAWIRRMSDG